ncbi:apoptosis-stimulating of p53 protein 1-like isoform X1 [Clytia hemisphaerica]|uniref:SH3 domain-containing protein n=1 Tax=Clytia hemisphaerica TaxID=252671 RepID=A0A7M5UZ84_9CNID
MIGFVQMNGLDKRKKFPHQHQKVKKIPSPDASTGNGDVTINKYLDGGINRAQLTLQELQSLAERQREQILYNSQELMEKQQQLMKMHHDYRAKLKAQQENNRSVPKGLKAHENHTTHTSLPQSPMAPHRTNRSRPSKGGVDQDQYAKMLRATYQNMGRIQSKNQMQHNLDVKKFNNTELTHELEKVRAAFAAKQNELADAVKKVDVLTHELEQRKNGENHPSVPTPERINRRKKIQNAKDELYRLQSELIIRNEMNSQQSHQLQLQRDIIQEKKQELKMLNIRMAELGNALRRQHGSGFDPRRSMSYGKQSPGLFNGTYLQDTLSRRKLNNNNSKPPPGQRDVNANIVPSPSKDQQQTERSEAMTSSPSTQHLRNGMVNGGHSSSSKSKSNFEDAPVSGNQVWRTDPKKSLNFDNQPQQKSSPLHSPASSISSLSSLSSASATPDESALSNKPAFPFKEAPPAPPTRTTPVGVLIDHNEPSQEDLAKLRAQNQKIYELQQELKKNTNLSLQSYNDSSLSSSKDDIRFQPYGDASSSCSKEELSSTAQLKSKPPPPTTKPKPPAVSPKPSIAAKPKINTTKPEEIEKTEVQTIRDDTIPDERHVNDHENNTSKTNDANSWSVAPPQIVNVNEPDEFELSFADIDEINDMQTDLWSNSGSSAGSQSSYDSETESYTAAPVPVVISVSPDKMPPPILMKPDKPRKQKRNVILDPFALLLDSALEGEMEMVKRTLMQVPDPSRPNPEGITALHNAVCGNHKEVVRYLVEVACDINAADNNGWTPLHCAAFYNDTELCRYLVESGASVFATTYTDYQTPAHKCSRLDDHYDECFAYLHECKENVGRIDAGLVHALYDYEGQYEDELSFYCGDELTILRRGDNSEKEWWWARDCKGNMGYIPCNLVGNYHRISAAV